MQKARPRNAWTWLPLRGSDCNELGTATQYSLDLRRQQLPPENETADCRDPAYCRENYREYGKRAWKQAEGNHEGDRLEPLRNAGQIVNRFPALAGGCYPTLSRPGWKTPERHSHWQRSSRAETRQVMRWHADSRRRSPTA